MKDPFAPLPDETRRKLRKRSHPDWVHPMLATLTDEPFSDEGWIYEPKLDGVRCLAFRHDDRVRLLSRNRKSQNAFYPELVEAIAAQEPRDFVVDGEVVAFHDHVTSFSRLQQRMKIADPGKALRSSVPVYYYLFDVVHLDGRDTTRLDLRDRKSLLERAITFRAPLRFSAHRNAEGEAYLAEACKKGWEGLIAKRADSTYVQRRSRDWLKFKCVARQEFVVGGWTDPQGGRVGLGALLVGVYDDGDLRYAGKVGTGF
ncbi:MAG TPA: non-homologous end-joining DNA ligase, partial [Gemmatimonadota bacterium]|nr:non-homologous end-joining DNA ligase [Gemmatimonadota bacterium]